MGSPVAGRVGSYAGTILRKAWLPPEPRARSIAVSAAVIGLVTVKRAKDMTIALSQKRDGCRSKRSADWRARLLRLSMLLRRRQSVRAEGRQTDSWRKDHPCCFMPQLSESRFAARSLVQVWRDLWCDSGAFIVSACPVTDSAWLWRLLRRPQSASKRAPGRSRWRARRGNPRTLPLTAVDHSCKFLQPCSDLTLAVPLINFCNCHLRGDFVRQDCLYFSLLLSN